MALARSLVHRALAAAGAYRRYQRVDWSRVRRVVFLCVGNICRSPYAERRLLDWGIPSRSAGFSGKAGEPSPAAAVRCALARGVSLDQHRALPLEEMKFVEGDLVAVFEPQHADMIREGLGDRAGVQVTIVGLWSRPPAPYLHDPYALSDDYFDACYQRIDAALEGIRDRIRSAAEDRASAS
jgi:protein-tyrosine phosphatase